MARKPRVEIEGGLYHIITRGNNRQLIFGSDDDYRKMLLLLAQQKAKLPFYLYVYRMMPNHIHLLVERRDDAISRVMHRSACRLQPIPQPQIPEGWPPLSRPLQGNTLSN